MTTAIKRRRGTTAQHATFTGLEGELTVDTTKDTVVVHDGATAGGFPLAKESQATTNVAITGGTITGITDLAVADGGTGASTAANARTNLGVTATGADTTYAYRANNLSDLASASTARTNLGLGTIATQAASSVAITGGTIDGTVIGGTTRAAGSFTTVTTTNDSSISGLTVGKGGGAISTNTAVGGVALNANTSGAYNSAFGNAALVGNTIGNGNNAFGTNALYANTSGSENTALGGAYSTTAALRFNTTGSYNIAVGGGALGNNTTSSNNTAVGYQSMYSNTIGDGQAFGAYALYSQTTGSNNTAIGATVLYANTTGVNNAGMGLAALRFNTTGGQNTALGTSALYSNTTASNNTAVGYQAAYSNTTGTQMVAIGRLAAYSNTTGLDPTALGANALYANTTGGYNTAVGNSAVGLNTTGSNNTGIGWAALYNNTTASNNTAVGYQAGYSNTTGTQNTFIGQYSGQAATTGLNSTFVGQGSGYLVTTGSKNTIIGSYSGNQGGLDIRTASNYIVLSDGDGNPRQVIDNNGTLLVGKTAKLVSTVGFEVDATGQIRSTCSATTNADLTNIVYSYGAGAYRFYVGLGGTVYATSTTITGISDQRVKENIVDLPDGLNAVMALKPRKFDWKEGKGKGIKGDRGFIAQEFETVFPDMIEEWKDPAPEGEEPYKAVNANLIPTLVKAIQELKAEVDSLKQQLGK